MINIIGWVGSILFAACAIPQAYQCYQQGHSKGINNWFLGLWFFGEILSLIYCAVVVKDIPILFNYSVNLACLLIILKYKVLPR